MPENLNHLVTGQGPYLFLSHSLSTEMAAWDPQLSVLEKHFTVVRFDTRGHGRSPVPNGPYTMQQLADDALLLIDSLGVEKLVWIGISLGGMIGQVVALARPGLVDRLVLIDTTSGYPPAAQASWNERIAHAEREGMHGVVDGTMGRWFTEAFRAQHPQTFAKIRDMVLATNPVGFVGCAHAVRDFDIRSDVTRIACPTLVLVGEHDQATPPDMARAIANSIPDAEFALIPEAAHQSGIERPDAVNAAISRFLNLADGT